MYQKIAGERLQALKAVRDLFSCADVRMEGTTIWRIDHKRVQEAVKILDAALKPKAGSV